MVKEYEEMKEKIREYYLNEGIIKYLSSFGQDREVVPVFKAKHYASRPSIMQYDTDYKIAIAEGATSFHASVERWSNPYFLKDAQNDRKKLDEIRSKWDLIIDIDAKESIEDAKVVGIKIIEFLEGLFDIHPIYIKFSGSRGFHIGISGDSFPEKILGRETSMLYPEMMHKIAVYVKEKVGMMLWKEGKGDIMKKVEVEDNWSYRHLFRMPYSLNEKTWLVSKVLTKDELVEFDINNARMESIEELKPFLNKPSNGEWELLFLEAEEYYEVSEYKKALEERIAKELEMRQKGIDIEEEVKEIKKEIKKIKGRPNVKINKEYFPNTIKRILGGIEDGKKRGVFILLNFLRKMNWSWEEVEKEIWEWNKRNPVELRESYIKSQINYFKRNENRIKDIYPPNFETSGYYDDMGVFDREDLKLGVKNPVSYAYKKYLMSLRGSHGKYNNNRHTRNRKNISK